MAYFIIKEPDKPVKFIKDVDRANGTMTFQEGNALNCLCKEYGFFADSEKEHLLFHFKEAYPELEYMEVYSGPCDRYDPDEDYDV